MEFFDFIKISEEYMELVNPLVPEKVLKVGEILGLKEGDRIIDFGCGYAEVEILWAEKFGISALGIDVRDYACERARKKLEKKGLSDRIEIVHGKGADYDYANGEFDTAICIGASFVFGGFQPTLKAIKKAIKPGGKLVIAEPYWLRSEIPPEYVRAIGENVFTELELLEFIRAEGCELEYIIRSSHEDWDRYECDNWYGYMRWFEKNPDHPDRDEVHAFMRKTQDEYLKYGREYMGFAVYILNPLEPGS